MNCMNITAVAINCLEDFHSTQCVWMTKISSFKETHPHGVLKQSLKWNSELASIVLKITTFVKARKRSKHGQTLYLA